MAYQQRGFDWVTACADDSPSTKEDGSGDGDTNENGIDVVDLREGGDAPEEVDSGRNDRGGADEEPDLRLSVHNWLSRG